MNALRIGWGWLIAVLGGLFAVAGAVLLSVGGSPYYVLVGLAMVASGALWGRGRERGRTLYLVVWVATLLWTLWEVGFDWLQWVPRMIAPSVLLIAFYANQIPKLFRGRHRRSIGGAIAAGVVAVALVPILSPERVTAQGANSASPGLRQPCRLPDRRLAPPMHWP